MGGTYLKYSQTSIMYYVYNELDENDIKLTFLKFLIEPLDIIYLNFCQSLGPFYNDWVKIDWVCQAKYFREPNLFNSI